MKDANRQDSWASRTSLSRLALMCALLSAAACKSIIGLEDHKFVDGDAGVLQSDLKSTCNQYCKDVVKNCTADGAQAYTKNSVDNCLAICENLPAGSKGATDGNSASCRAFYAKDAAGGENEQISCQAAAPGGGSPPPEPKPGEVNLVEPPPSCGSNCDTYCSVYKQVCPEATFVDPECMEHCPGIFDRGSFSATSDFEGADDTIQCRLAHLTAAAYYKKQGNDGDRKAHCGHSKLEPSRANDGLPCDLQPDKAPSCENYCSLVMGACATTNPQYESSGQCLKFCQGALKADPLPKGMIDNGKDTLNCRRWHAYAAMFELTSHCGHAGPTGDGHCEENVCKVYCGQLEKACSTRFSKEFPGTGPVDQCRMQCEKIVPGVKDVGYAVNKSETRENTFFCRVRNLVKVYEGRMSGTGMGMAACEKPGLFFGEACTPMP